MVRLLERGVDGEITLTKNLVGPDIPPYAILSHTWGADAEEVTFNGFVQGTGQNKIGYAKIRFCAEQARQDSLRYFWIDACCIDKSNSTELTEAINSMFQWYFNVTRCYVYLADVSSLPEDRRHLRSPLGTCLPGQQMVYSWLDAPGTNCPGIRRVLHEREKATRGQALTGTANPRHNRDNHPGTPGRSSLPIRDR